MRSVELIWQSDCLLGEGPAWFGDEQLLRFVDIKRGNLHVFNPLTNAKETHFLGGSPSFILPETGGDLLVGSRQSIWRMDGNSYGKEVARIPEPANNRTNDATVDAEGRIWLGTMDDQEQQRSGAVWCWDKAKLHRAGAEAVVTNGPAVSPNGRWIYCVDSGERTIWRFPLQPNSKLEAGEIFITIEKGFPDGIIVDSAGNLWVALWDGWAVRQYDPNGNLILEVPIPCARATKIALGGPDLCTAFVTTARIGLNADELAKQPLAGALFSFCVKTPGQILPSANLYL